MKKIETRMAVGLAGALLLTAHSAAAQSHPSRKRPLIVQAFSASRALA